MEDGCDILLGTIDGENWDNGFKACLFVTAPRPTLELAN